MAPAVSFSSKGGGKAMVRIKESIFKRGRRCNNVKATTLLS
jgi:hypothetical protein